MVTKQNFHNNSKSLKILFPLLKAGSGSDIFTNNLVTGLQNSSIQTGIQYIPKWSGFFPLIMGKLCKSAGYDIIHANSWNGYAFKKNLPLVITEHHLVHDPVLTKYKNLAQRIYHTHIYQCERKSINCADSLICVSKYTQDKIEEVFGYSHSLLIYNGIDARLFKPVSINKSQIIAKLSIPSNKKVLFFSGNPTIRKGGDLLPKIMHELGDDYVLLLTEGLRKNSPIQSSNIISLGTLSLQALIKMYNFADIFLFPTRLEGFGLSVAEAMACGKPVVATNCSSIPELLIDGKGGFLCEMDNVADFAESIRILAEDPSLRREMGVFNRNRVLEKFTLDRMAQEYSMVYKKL